MKHSGLYTIRTSEITADKTLAVPSMIMLMQEASMQNVIKLKASVWDMEGDAISWVLLRKKLKVFRYPLLGETVRIVTYPSYFEKIFAYRDYKIYDQGGEMLAQASSTWTLLNTETRKLQKIPDNFLNMPTPNDEEKLDPPSSKIALIESKDFSKTFRVGWFDTDWNEHANNVFLVKSIIEASPPELLRNKSIKELVYHIRSESFWNEELTINGQKLKNNLYAYEVLDAPLGKVIAQASIEWT